MNISDLIIKGIVSVYTVDLGVATYTNANRPYSAFCLKAVGYSVYTQDGIEHFSDSSHLILVPKGCTYSYSVKEKGSCTIIEFIAENVPSTIESLEINDGNIAKALVSNIEYAWAFKRAGYRENCLSCIYQLLYHVALHQSNAYIAKVHQRRLESSMRYLYNHFCDHHLSITTIAMQSDISEIYFRKLFTQIYGVSPKKYVTTMRMQRAKELMDVNELSISQIAEAVGYVDIFSFCKVFRREIGSTPTEYRKHLRRDEAEEAPERTEEQ